MESGIHLADFAIQPADIDTDRHFCSAFGNMEKEISAYWIVYFCQELGNWGPFTRDQVQEFYDRKRKEKNKPSESFWYNGLLDEYIKEENGQLYVTGAFVARCYGSSPKKT